MQGMIFASFRISEIPCTITFMSGLPKRITSVCGKTFRPFSTFQSPFSGKTIVVTGEVEPYTRDEMNGIIVSLGATAGSSVTRKTDYLVCGEKAGSKLSKAQELGIQILEPEEFFRLAGVA